MRLIYEASKPDRVMHIQKFTQTGEGLFESLCAIKLAFNRTINLPLGRKICKNCKKKLQLSKGDIR